MNADLKWLTDPEVFRVNRLDAHSDHVCYASEEEAERECSSLRQSLDGEWGFFWSPRPADRPENFWQEGYDESAFGTIRVPGHMELQGHGQIQYINTLYPWDGHAELRPPEIDWNDNPVGSYVRYFTLEPGLRGKRVCISFQGVEQAFYVWLNGRFVGYSEDTFTPSDFDLTEYLREGENRLCVEVYKRSSAGWIEDQDFFRFSGIFRTVYLYAKPELHVEDLWLMTDLKENTGTLRLRLKLSGKVGGARLTCLLRGPDGSELLEQTPKLTEENGFLFSPVIPVEPVCPWSHESPSLYSVTLTVRTADGRVQEVIPYEIGFRHLALENGILYLNGRRLVIRGVNRHEWNPNTGRAITEDDMTAAMDTFLRNNINAVRTCHYPNQSPWYRMCDRKGIYMMDETNLESHGSWQKLGKVEPSWNVPGSLPQWKACVLDRAASMFERDKNHPSILFWSCGNEAYAGEDILAMADYFRAQDSTRVVHYEGVFHNREFDAISDVESRMYATPEDIRQYLESSPAKPFLLCEYMHDMGNSLGGMESYIRLEEEFPQYQGGFIWDYMDQALWQTNSAGQRVLGYGGDFGERQTDYAFSGNGIVFADGREKPAMQEVRYWYADAREREEIDRKNQAFRLPEEAPGERMPLTVVHGDGALGVRRGDTEILFSYPMGGPVSLRKDGREWLWRAAKPALWRAATENDLGNSFAVKSAVWSAVEQWLRCDDIAIVSESSQRVELCYTYGSCAMEDLRIQVTYIVDADGFMEVNCRYRGAEGRPQLPVFGLRFATPVPVDQIHWLGRSGETYPDRRKGGILGEYREAPHIPDYLVPQECGGHEGTSRCRLEMAGGEALQLDALEKPFGFSAIPYTPQQLEQACHVWELPEPCRTVVTVYGAMRGVGGIDSWMTDVEKAYHLPADRDLEFSFLVRL